MRQIPPSPPGPIFLRRDKHLGQFFNLGLVNQTERVPTLGYWYDLSKRTMLYGHYGHEKGDSLPALNRYEMGVRHDF